MSVLRLAAVALYLVAAAAALWAAADRLPIGWRRAALALPLVVINLLVPLAFDPGEDLVLHVLVGLNVMWLGSFKVAGWALGRGPLCERLSLPQFAAVFALPITPVLKSAAAAAPSARGNARQGEVGHAGPAACAAAAAGKLAGLVGVLVALPAPWLPRLGQEALYSLGLYLFMGFVFDCMEAAVGAALRLPVAPNFDAPFLATSLTDFWSRRWNLTTGYTCRFLVYDVVLEGQLLKPRRRPGRPARPGAARRAAAVCASFAASAAMHELFLLYLRGRFSGYWFAFFAAQGPLVVAEAAARRARRARGLAVPRALSVVLTLAALVCLADALFFPDILRMRLPQDVFLHLYALLPSAVQALAPNAVAAMS